MFGPGLAAYLSFLKSISTTALVLSMTVYTINVIFTLLASEDTRDDPVRPRRPGGYF